MPTIPRLSILVVAVVLFGCFKPADTSEYPTLVVDEIHQFGATNASPAYQVAPGSGIRIETDQFQFKYGTSSVAPNMVQVILGKSRLYKLSRPTETNLYVLDRTTLEPLGPESFSGFHSGDSGMLMIGRTDPKAVGKESVFVLWVANFKVN